MEKVQNILSDEESMKQIKELADMLSAPSGNNSATNDNSVPDLSSLFSALGANTNNSQQSKANITNSEQPDLTSLLSALGNNNNSNNNMPVATTPQNKSDGLGIDFGTIMKLQGLMQTASQNDKTTDLLIALKPLLNEKRQVKVDKAVKLMKIWALYNVAKDSGIINIDKLL